jgi:uncharacterized protein
MRAAAGPAALLALLLAAPASALEVPALRGRVNDLAGLLPAARREALEQKLAAFEAETSHQIVVLTVPSLEGEPIEEFALRVAEAWAPGHRGLDNGILLVVAPRDRAVRVEVGYGLEGVVPDAVAARIVRDHLIPEFRAGRMAEGIEAGVASLCAAARGEEIPAARRPRPGGGASGRSHVDPGAVLFFAAFLGMLVGSPFQRARLRPVGGVLGGGAGGLLAWLLLASLGWALLAGVIGAFTGWGGLGLGGRGGRRGRGGFGGRLGDGWPGGGGWSGGGGFSGGGGGFGGGGASGRW